MPSSPWPTPTRAGLAGTSEGSLASTARSWAFPPARPAAGALPVIGITLATGAPLVPGSSTAARALSA
eukprot:1019982-Alexandrium_andersonii.AAC.1